MAAPERVDVAVVGSGPGGAVAACMLAEAGRRVTILEEGPALAQDSCRPFSSAELRQKYRNGGVTATFGGGKVAYVEGRVVGGGSEVNSGLYHRAPEETLALWRDATGLEGASDAEMTAHFEACERDLGVGPSLEAPSLAETRFLAGAGKLGLTAARARRIGEYTGGPAAPRWTRRPMSKTYLPRALSAGAELRPDTRVVSLRREGGRWTLRTARSGAEGPSLEADAVFLACGAIHTPALLRRSGFGGRIGAGLALHPMLKVVAEFDAPMPGNDSTIAAAQVKDPRAALFLGCSVSTPSNIALALSENDPDAAARWRKMRAFYCSAGEGSSGAVRALPGFRDPLATYRLHPEDLGVLTRSLDVLTRLLLDQGAVAVYPAIAGVGAVRSSAQLASALDGLREDRLRLTSVHLMASCRMGERDGAPLDSFGRVVGADGLVVCDASVFCGPLGVNPQGAVMAFSRRNATAFLERR